jgi:hypothetical protein
MLAACCLRCLLVLSDQAVIHLKRIVCLSFIHNNQNDIFITKINKFIIQGDKR